MEWVKLKKQKLNKSEWHLWFAWRPVVVQEYPDGSIRKVWGKTVLKRVYWVDSHIYSIMPYKKAEYKELPEQPNVPDKPTKAPIPKTTELRANCPPVETEPKVDLFDDNHNLKIEAVQQGSYMLNETEHEDDECMEYTKEDFREDVPKESLDMSLIINYGECSLCKVPLTSAGDCTNEECVFYKPCLHDNGTIEKMGGNICRDCGIVMGYGRDRLTIPAKIQEPNLRKQEAMKEAFRATMTPWKPKHDWKDCNGCEDCIEGWTEPEELKHEIDVAWEVKNARRNKTIM